MTTSKSSNLKTQDIKSKYLLLQNYLKLRFSYMRIILHMCLNKLLRKVYKARLVIYYIWYKKYALEENNSKRTDNITCK